MSLVELMTIDHYRSLRNTFELKEDLEVSSTHYTHAHVHYTHYTVHGTHTTQYTVHSLHTHTLHMYNTHTTQYTVHSLHTHYTHTTHVQYTVHMCTHTINGGRTIYWY